METDSQEKELDNEFEQILSSLPREEGWWTPHFYQYQGFWYPPNVLQGVIAFQKHFEACDTDIILVSAPKAGTTWLKSLAFAVLNHDSLSKNQLLTTNPHGLMPQVELDIVGRSDSKFLYLFNLPSPRVLATHINSLHIVAYIDIDLFLLNCIYWSKPQR